MSFALHSVVARQHELPCDLSKKKPNLKEPIIYHDIHVNHFKKYQMWKKLRMGSHYFLDHPRSSIYMI